MQVGLNRSRHCVLRGAGISRERGGADRTFALTPFAGWGALFVGAARWLRERVVLGGSVVFSGWLRGFLWPLLCSHAASSGWQSWAFSGWLCGAVLRFCFSCVFVFVLRNSRLIASPPNSELQPKAEVFLLPPAQFKIYPKHC